MKLGLSEQRQPSSSRARRVTFLRPVHVRPLGETGPMKRMFAANLSRGGMYVRSPSAFPPGTPVEVFLEAGGRVLRFADAVVAFALPRGQALAHGRLPGFGLRFTHLPPRSRALVDHLLELLRERPGAKPQARRAPNGVVPAAAAGTGRKRRIVGAVLALAFGGASAAAALAHFGTAWLAH